MSELMPNLFASGELVAGNYEIRAILGQGGMGEVYDAHDRLLSRKVALKIERPGAPDGALRREGQALAAIRHPSVVTVHTMGTHTLPQGGKRGIELDFLVLERVYGVSLEETLRQRGRRGETIQMGEALDLLTSIAEGLAVVHRAGISHRDVKPANIMLAPGNRTVLMDFGLMLAEVDTPRRDVVFGSLGYMAPEALAAQDDRGAGFLLDMYALGVIAYELLTGRLPFVAEDAEALYAAQVGVTPLLANQRSDVPAPLNDLVRDLLRPDPAERPQSAESVLWQLRSVRDRLRASGRDEPFTALIVDDDEDMYQPLTLYVRLAVPSAIVETAGTGAAALKAVRKKVPHLLLLDLDLPDMNGVEVCMHLRGMALGDRCLLVSVSGRATDADVALLKQLDVEFVEKGPELMTQLLGILKRVRTS
jgi:eukaryotic-like serine/threonine-protein kinase